MKDPKTNLTALGLSGGSNNQNEIPGSIEALAQENQNQKIVDWIFLIEQVKKEAEKREILLETYQ